MKLISFSAVAVLTLSLVFTGCKKKEQCASGDSPEVCKAVQECFASDTSTEVCREAEKDANKKRTDLPTATSGSADGLNYDSSKASQKSASKPSTKQ